MTNPAARWLPPLAVISAFALSAVLLRPRAEPVAKPVVKPERTAFTIAINDTADDIEGCFLEYDAREPGDAEMRLSLLIDPDGVTQPRVVSGPTHSSLRMCVEASLKRLDYVPGLHVWADLVVSWKNRSIHLAPTITMRQPARDGRRHN